VILVDTSVWIDHFRTSEPTLADALSKNRVVMHPFVLGELACGHFRNRQKIFALLRALPDAPVATDAEALELIERKALMGRGIGYIDVHLLAAATLMVDGLLWTRDQRLAAVAGDLSLGFSQLAS
jgi:predicted nucleic acid-binding protein